MAQPSAGVDEDGPPRIRELDFSEFHPLDHLPASAYCRSLPGGIRRHLAYGWQYKWPTQLGRMTLCRVGWHRWTKGWHHDEPCVLCRNCWLTKPS